MPIMPKPKLLLVADTYYPKVDGTLKFIEEFTKRAQDNFQISLLVPYLGERKGYNVTYVQPSRILYLSGYPSIKFSFHNIQCIKKAIKAADVVFVQGPALLSYLSIYYARRYKKKTIFYLHVISWELFAKFMPRFLHKLFFRLLKSICISFYNRCNEILVPYHDLRQQLARNGVTSSITVARLGVDIELFSPSHNKKESKSKLGIDPNKMVIGYVGRISKEKNVTVLREAFQKLKHKDNTLLLMVGDGPEEQTGKFREIANCKVTGFVNNVHDYLKAIDIFVMPSLTETTSLATLEAMACGLPVIATKVGFIQHYLVKGHNGLFFPRGSSTMLAVKMEKLLADSLLREKLGRNARRTVAYSFSWERSINKIKHILYRHNL